MAVSRMMQAGDRRGSPSPIQNRKSTCVLYGVLSCPKRVSRLIRNNDRPTRASPCNPGCTLSCSAGVTASTNRVAGVASCKVRSMPTCMPRGHHETLFAPQRAGGEALLGLERPRAPLLGGTLGVYQTSSTARSNLCARRDSNSQPSDP